ncbi:MAG TPA: aromatic ring-hydroxylating dioxygenase subunit alpha [Stellaceae bacterium]|nr:aromatic ring-hydroxylating dioxygenase subunit alpha [Stellaceae bacterium]
MFLMNQWYAAALGKELGPRPLARTICDVPVVMFRTETGKAAALDDRCPHRYAPLSAGECRGEIIACAYHGIEFGADGACTLIPHQPNIPPKMRVRSYPFVERWGWAWIWLGDPLRADPSTIPDYAWFGAAGWHSFQRHYYVKANWEICADNLLDLSHTPFIHKKTVGVPEMATIPVETTVEGDRVFQRRVMSQVVPSPFVAEWGGFKGRIDRRATVVWEPASNMNAELLYEDSANSIILRLTNPVTPETERTTHVWFAWSRNFGSASDADPMALRFQEQSYAVMAEDVSFMEIQQQGLDRAGDFQPVAIRADATLIQARRIVERLRQEERAQARRQSA